MLFLKLNKYQYTYLNTYIALHSVTLKPPENTPNTMKHFSFPLIAHYPLAGPPLPHTPPLHRETRPHPHLLAIQKIAHTSGEGGREYVSVQGSILIFILF